MTSIPARTMSGAEELAEVKAELEKYKRGAKTLGEIIEKQCREALDVTGLHHLINEDGDGHWDAVWMRLHEMRDELADLKESTLGRERKRGDSWRDRAQEMELSRDAAVERAEAVAKLHQPRESPPLSFREIIQGKQICDSCLQPYPCATTKALTAALSGEGEPV